MGRKLRYLPSDNHLVEVTCRVIQRRFLLRPSPQLNAIIIGTLARFQKRYRMRICGLIYLSNHCHLLLRPDIVTSHEPEAQIARLRYLLEQGCKEGLVASPRHWPGASSIRALLSGESLEGIWIDRTEQFRARESGRPDADALFTFIQRLEISPLPCWDELTPAQCQTKVRTMVREIEAQMDGVAVLGKKTICEQDPHDWPVSQSRRTPAPRFHALAPRVRRALEIGYHLVRRAYRQAFEDWKAGKLCEFPAGCFAPGRFTPLRS